MEVDLVKSALIIGCAANVWEDVEAVKRITTFDAIYCVKAAGIHYPGSFKTWITLHPEIMDDYEAQRHAKGLPNGYEIVAPPQNELGSIPKDKGRIARRVSYLWPDASTSASASSGIYGAKVALEDGFDRVVLAGIPMTPEAGHFMPESKTVQGQVRGNVWHGHSSFVDGFNYAVPFLIGKVKSMSGHTQKVLGMPASNWIDGE